MAPVSKTDPSTDDDFMTAGELSERWRLSEQTLANLRSQGEGPPYTKVGRGSIRYKVKTILAIEKEQSFGFCWEDLKAALTLVDCLSPAQRAEVYQTLRRKMK